MNEYPIVFSMYCWDADIWDHRIVMMAGSVLREEERNCDSVFQRE